LKTVKPSTTVLGWLSSFILQLSRSSVGFEFDNPNLKLFSDFRDDGNRQQVAASIGKLVQCLGRQNSLPCRNVS